MHCLLIVHSTPKVSYGTDAKTKHTEEELKIKMRCICVSLHFDRHTFNVPLNISIWMANFKFYCLFSHISKLIRMLLRLDRLFSLRGL